MSRPKGYKLSEESKEKIRQAKLENPVKYWLGKKRGEEFCKKIRESKLNKKNPNWKGNDVKYRALHQWIESKLGKPKRCETCNTTEAKRYDWANKDHKYRRNINDYIRLCKSCHEKFDMQNQLTKVRGVNGQFKKIILM